MMNEWKKYPNNRLMQQCDGFVVIVPDDLLTQAQVPLCCPVCDHVLRSYSDETSYREFECCERCAMLWAHARREQWKSGWRPTPEDVCEAEKDRPKLTVSFDVD